MSEGVTNEQTQESPVLNKNSETQETIIENKLYYLVSGEVMARLKDVHEQVYLSKHNSIITGSGEHITPHDLATAQWSMENNYLESLSEDMRDKVEVSRVAIISITPLGYFTKEEWDSYYNA